MKTRMPYVGLKLPLTFNESFGDVRLKSRPTPSLAARKEGDKLRSRYDAVLVGATTVERDNPELTVKLVRGRNPLRVILDPSLKLNPASAVFRTRKAGTLVFTSARAMSARKFVVDKLRKQGVYMLGLDRSRPFDLRIVLRTLAALGVSSLLVEGGVHTSREFLEQRLVHKVHAVLDPRVKWGRSSSNAILHRITAPSLGSNVFLEGSI